jgi:hypothetical protein
MMRFVKKNRRWIMGGGAVLLVLGGLGWQLWGNSAAAVKASCLNGGGEWDAGTCRFR